MRRTKRTSTKRTTTKRTPKSLSTKTPTSQQDSPIALALIHVDSLLLRIRTDRVKAFDASAIEQLRKLSDDELKDLNRNYRCTFDGMKSALTGDPYSLECYSNFTKAQLKIVVEFLKNIRTLRHDEQTNGKKIRLGSIRPLKEKAPDEIVKKVLYLEKDPETGVASIKPEKLLGASELWVYNVKTRKLGCYRATSPEGLSVKGTTILNYDEKTSTAKMLRVPKKQVREFMAGKAKWMCNYWNAIKTVPQKIPPRLNRDTLILAAYLTL
jgi:hypothetical protein